MFSLGWVEWGEEGELDRVEDGVSSEEGGRIRGETLYGDIIRIMLSNTVHHGRKKVSLWWKDICMIGSGGDSPLDNWFPSSILCKLGNGDNIDFWQDRWLGGIPLCDRFPSLFLLADYGCSKVNDNGFWISGKWEWRINFSEAFSREAEDVTVGSLLSVLEGKAPVEEEEDSFVWWRNSSGYSVKAAYQMIVEGKVREPIMDENLVKALMGLWKTKIPSKVLIFGWRLLLNRIPTKMNLARRNILVDPTLLLCPLCGLDEENADHLFASCTVSLRWWTIFCDWLRIDIPSSSGNIFTRLCCLESICRLKFTIHTRWLFGMAFCWGIWICRNEVVFNRGVVSSFDMMGLLKFVSWEWFLSSYNVKDASSWDEWCANPTLCF
ncbi:uncharacterized protein LOC131629813 [Vicia villosa]|uniref:uncharacterized protein LOC131629813 n=1 Tax=Vicia villosa TaxID=3911 RepID=UPI00273C9376|nr:uncharacterized protein LOC131629813 [Vicia villosa]